MKESNISTEIGTKLECCENIIINVDLIVIETSFLYGAIEVKPIKRKTLLSVSNKNISCVDKLGGFRVCKEFFMRTLNVSNKCLQNVVNKKKGTESGVFHRDKRGTKQPQNKIPQNRINTIKEHINRFLRYTSHYSREKAPNRKYLDFRLSLKQMYQLYVIYCQEKHVDAVKERFYRHVFNTQFNLSFHRPCTDTCDKL